MKNKLILYHAHCNDGFGAAWVAHRVYGRKAEYRPVQYGDPPPEDVVGRDVLILDFSYPRDRLLQLRARTNSLLVLDHHLTAQEDLEGLDFARFNLDQSGATLTWSHFFPGKECPWLLRYIEDRDLWRFALPESEEVAAALQSYGRNFPTWTKLIERGRDALVEEGRPVLRYKNRLVKAAASRYRMIQFEGFTVPKVTSSILQSEIGSTLAARFPFVVIVFELADRRIWSMRSRADGGINVAEIARRNGGGGHPNAASFVEFLDPPAGSAPSASAAVRPPVSSDADPQQPEDQESI